MPGKNMFAAFASDSEDEFKAVETKKTSGKEKSKKEKDETREVIGTRKAEEGEFDYAPKRTRASRGRGRGGRGRGRGGQHFEGEYRGGRGGRGFGRGRGRGHRGGRGRGGYGRRDGPREAYSHLATKEQVVGEGFKEEEHAEEGEYRPRRHEGYNKRSGTGYGRETKKGGAGKGGWGAPEEESRKYTHMEANEAAEAADGADEKEETKEEQAPKEPEQEEVEQEEEEEEVNNLTYSEYMAQKKAAGALTKKGAARKPEELKVDNIQNYNKNDTRVKSKLSTLKKHEGYSTGGISADVEVGFQPIGDEEVEDFDRPRRGRGGRGRGRGAHRGGFENQHGAGKRQGKKRFNAQDEDFPSL